jgi:predicted glycosyltransferase involved in capsule biosynthesis
MKVEIFVPWAHDPGRTRGLALVDRYLADNFHDQYHGLAVCEPPFTRAKACNLAAASSKADVIVFNDADSLVWPEQFEESFERAFDLKGAVRAYSRYYRISEAATKTLIRWQDAFDAETCWMQEHTASHGVFAVHRQTFVDAGGYDPRFVYFYDDLSFDIRAGQIPQERVQGDLVHLWHPPREAPESDEQLWFRYEHEDPFQVRAEVGFPL